MSDYTDRVLLKKYAVTSLLLIEPHEISPIGFFHAALLSDKFAQ